MIPASFDYVRAGSPSTRPSTCSVEHGEDAKMLAGGHSLLPLMKLRLATPEVLVDIGRLCRAVLRPRRWRPSRHRGPDDPPRRLTRPPLAGAELPVLAHVAGQIGDPQVRHRGTIGGSIAHGDPASDLPALVLALGGTLVAAGSGEARGSRPPSSSSVSSRRRSAPTRCSPRSACRRAVRAAGASRRSPARPGLGHRGCRGRASEREWLVRRGVDQRGSRCRCGPPPWRRRWPQVPAWRRHRLQGRCRHRRLPGI